MNINDIKELIGEVKKTGIESLKFENNGIKLEIKNSIDKQIVENIIEPEIEKVEVAEVTETNEVDNNKYESIDSPLVGVFYESPSPEHSSFVENGQKVKKGDVLCIVEAMKVMNEIVAKKDCVIKEVLVKNEEIVEHGQSLFLIE